MRKSIAVSSALFCALRRGRRAFSRRFASGSLTPTPSLLVVFCCTCRNFSALLSALPETVSKGGCSRARWSGLCGSSARAPCFLSAVCVGQPYPDALVVGCVLLHLPQLFRFAFRFARNRVKGWLLSRAMVRPVWLFCPRFALLTAPAANALSFRSLALCCNFRCLGRAAHRFGGCLPVQGVVALRAFCCAHARASHLSLRANCARARIARCRERFRTRTGAPPGTAYRLLRTGFVQVALPSLAKCEPSVPNVLRSSLPGRSSSHICVRPMISLASNGEAASPERSANWPELISMWSLAVHNLDGNTCRIAR